MKLIIDLGNTLAKFALFNKDQIVETISSEKLSKKNLTDYLDKNPLISSAILASVINYSDEIKLILKEKIYLLELNPSTLIPIENLYSTPKSLGNDRIAAAVGGNQQFKDQNVLIIDAGTCIKYDFVNHKNQYLGGSISPGIAMRFKALNTFTDKLPLLDSRNINQDLPFEENLIGANTQDSILSGVLKGTIIEVKGIINEYQQKFPGLKTIFTGGDLNFFIGQLKKNSIFADPFLVLKGLNAILDFNTKTI